MFDNAGMWRHAKRRRGGRKDAPGLVLWRGKGRSGTEGEGCLPGACDSLGFGTRIKKTYYVACSMYRPLGEFLISPSKNYV